MSRVLKLGLAAVLMTTLFVRPILLDGCAATCDERSADQSATATCHHDSAATTAALRETPRPCGHDHHGSAFVAAGTSTSCQPLPGATSVSSVGPAGVFVWNAGSPVHAESPPAISPPLTHIVVLRV